MPTAEDGWLSPRRGSLSTVSEARRQREDLQDATLQARAADVRCLLQEATPPPAVAPQAHSSETQRPARARRTAGNSRRTTRDIFR